MGTEKLPNSKQPRWLRKAPFDDARASGQVASNGRPICRWCGVGVKPPKRSWCGQVCIDAFLIRSHSGTARRKVFKRDGGVCVDCRMDTCALGQVLETARKLQQKEGWRGYRKHPGGLARDRRMSVPGHRYYSSLWDVDHVVPVDEGGGACGLDNLQTLCIWCHAEKTAKQAAERATHRKSKRRVVRRRPG